MVTDIERLQLDAKGIVVDRRDLLFGLKLARAGEEWEWKLAPRPEVDRRFDYFRRVVGVVDWK